MNAQNHLLSNAVIGGNGAQKCFDLYKISRVALTVEGAHLRLSVLALHVDNIHKFTRVNSPGERRRVDFCAVSEVLLGAEVVRVRGRPASERRVVLVAERHRITLAFMTPLVARN